MYGHGNKVFFYTIQSQAYNAKQIRCMHDSVPLFVAIPSITEKEVIILLQFYSLKNRYEYLVE